MQECTGIIFFSVILPLAGEQLGGTTDRVMTDVRSTEACYGGEV